MGQRRWQLVRGWAVRCAAVGWAGLWVSGCGAPSMDPEAGLAFYDHRYGSARDAVRDSAAVDTSENVVLDNLRLGIASMADGDLAEAERALLRAYELLVSGGVNEADRAAAATFLYEGVRVWKGEPYEQAMSFYLIAVRYMLDGDWENGRAAATNALFTLRDFEGGDGGEPRSMAALVTDAAAAERDGEGDYFESAGRPVDSEFALGYLTAAACDVLMGRGDAAGPLFDRVRGLNPELGALVDVLEAGDYDTLLFVDVGLGPMKESYGPNGALVRYEPDGREIPRPVVSVAVDGVARSVATTDPVVDLWTLSQYPKWWSLEPMREAKSTIGGVLLYGGMAAMVLGDMFDESDAQWAGLGAALAGLMVQGSAAADTRHLAELPRCVFMVPLKLGVGRHDVGLAFEHDAGSNGTWHDLTAGAGLVVGGCEGPQNQGQAKSYRIESRLPSEGTALGSGDLTTATEHAVEGIISSAHFERNEGGATVIVMDRVENKTSDRSADYIWRGFGRY